MGSRFQDSGPLTSDVQARRVSSLKEIGFVLCHAICVRFRRGLERKPKLALNAGTACGA